MNQNLNHRIATVEQLHMAAKEKTLCSIRLAGETKLKNEVYDTWIFRYTDREDEILYVGRSSR